MNFMQWCFLAIAIAAGIFEINFILKFIMYIKQDMHPEEIGQCISWISVLGIVLGIAIYFLV